MISTQRYVVVGDHPTCSAIPVLRELMKDAACVGPAAIIFVAFARPPRVVLRSDAEVVDFSDCIPGFTSRPDLEVVQTKVAGWQGDIYLDGVDTLDHPSALVRTVRRMAPEARVIVTTTADTELLVNLSVSAAVTLIEPYPVSFLNDISRTYLATVDGQKFWDIVETTPRAFGTGLAVRVTSRKATGGAKGMSRDLIVLQGDLVRGVAGAVVGAADLELPFNLALTDEQRRRRDAIPIPYVHEGEGVEMGWDEEDDEI